MIRLRRLLHPLAKAAAGIARALRRPAGEDAKPPRPRRIISIRALQERRARRLGPAEYDLIGFRDGRADDGWN